MCGSGQTCSTRVGGSTGASDVLVAGALILGHLHWSLLLMTERLRASCRVAAGLLGRREDLGQRRDSLFGVVAFSADGHGASGSGAQAHDGEDTGRIDRSIGVLQLYGTGEVGCGSG
ncbi:hypothetical protein BEK98_16310 [Streptomyces diastatochromogenes]|uniref:Uncharacterized protein n=1 Tax=Streptomyces diastatochromogenes TaxID=42236 RepID=A0A233SJB8_STRDA|nr:hypothetical protein BEK98_16310 [Streptomyces diastatochromogenes]